MCFSSDLAQETLKVAGLPHSLRRIGLIILVRPLAAAITTLVLTAQPCSRNLRIYSCICSSRFLPRSKGQPLFFNGSSPTVKSSSSLNLFACLSFKYSCLNLRAVLSLTGYFNFLENRLAAAEVLPVYPIRLVPTANKLVASFLFESWYFLTIPYLMLHVLHDWQTQLQ